MMFRFLSEAIVLREIRANDRLIANASLMRCRSMIVVGGFTWRKTCWITIVRGLYVTGEVARHVTELRACSWQAIYQLYHE